MGIKEIYNSIEEKYYKVLDKVNAIVPVYAIIDPIDKIVPSFLLILALVLVAIVALAAIALPGIFPVFGPSSSQLIILVKDTDNKPISAVKIDISGTTFNQRDQRTDNGGRLQFDEVPFGETLEISAKKNGYSAVNQSIQVRNVPETVQIVLQKEEQPPEPVTIQFLSPSGSKLIGTAINAHLECTNVSVELGQKDFIVEEGELTVTPPKGCGFITVAATAQGYKKNNAVVATSLETIRFEAEEIPKARILVVVTGSDRPLSDIWVTIYNSANDTLAGSRTITTTGEALFNLPVGAYYASVEDPSGNFASTKKDFTVENAADHKTVDVELRKQIRAVLKIKVVDKASRNSIDGAKVYLRKNSGEQVGSREITAESNTAEFSVEESGIYYVSASKDNYLAGEELEIDLGGVQAGSTIEKTVELQKCTPSICGVLNVRVVDEEGKPVENATVHLLDAEKNVLAQGFDERSTDFNGWITPFRNVGIKKVKAIAQKYPSSGTSEAIDIDTHGVNNLTVTMEIGEGIVQINAVDQDNVPIAFATAELRTEAGEAIGTISLDEKGETNYSVKADKKVFVKVKAQGFTAYTTVAKQVLKGTRIKFVATLNEELLERQPTAKFLGIYTKGSDKKVDNLSAGSSYVARFQMLVPQEEDYTQLGLHVR
jgi:hypothetical protein